MASNINYTVRQGATLASYLTVSLNSVAVDLTGASLLFTAKPLVFGAQPYQANAFPADTDPSTVKVTWTETATPTTGNTWLIVPASATAGMAIGTFYYQIWVVGARQLPQVTEIATGNIIVQEPVSERLT